MGGTRTILPFLSRTPPPSLLNPGLFAAEEAPGAWPGSFFFFAYALAGANAIARITPQVTALLRRCIVKSFSCKHFRDQAAYRGRGRTASPTLLPAKPPLRINRTVESGACQVILIGGAVASRRRSNSVCRVVPVFAKM